MIYGVYGSTFGCNINLQRNCPFAIDNTEKKIDHLFIWQIGGNHRLNLDRWWLMVKVLKRWVIIELTSCLGGLSNYRAVNNVREICKNYPIPH